MTEEELVVERQRLMHEILWHERYLDAANRRQWEAPGTDITDANHALWVMVTVAEVSYLPDDAEKEELMRRVMDCQRGAVLRMKMLGIIRSDKVRSLRQLLGQTGELDLNAALDPKDD